uniref:Kazal-like domain-containing protein n=1 Tax=Anopheles quadriannulatus TaxID=34691 RepID=A0A182X0N5_ANOQN
MHYTPVCGNNNRTYHNYCILRCMRIRVNRTLEMAHRWECGTTPDEQKALDLADEPWRMFIEIDGGVSSIDRRGPGRDPSCEKRPGKSTNDWAV